MTRKIIYCGHFLQGLHSHHIVYWSRECKDWKWKFIEEKKRAQELNTRHLGLSEPPRFVFPTCNNKFSNLPLLQIQTHNHWFAQPAALPDSLKDQNSLFTALSCLPDRFYCNPGNPYIITQCRAFFFNLARPASSNVQWQITTGFHSRTR